MEMLAFAMPSLPLVLLLLHQHTCGGKFLSNSKSISPKLLKVAFLFLDVVAGSCRETVFFLYETIDGDVESVRRKTDFDDSR
jgi:hypothetical protein